MGYYNDTNPFIVRGKTRRQMDIVYQWGPYKPPLRQAMQPAELTTVAQQRIGKPVHTAFQVRFRLIKLPVVRNPLSPIAPRHSIDN
jgi:hypothetical protein